MSVFYHLVTRQPVHEHQFFDFSQGQPNRQAKFFLDHPDKLPLNDLLKTPRLNLSSEQTTQLRHDWDRRAHALRELILEVVRIRDFPQYPSRLACLFAAKSYDQVLIWRNLFEKEGRHVCQLVKVVTAGPTFEGDAASLPSITSGTVVDKLAAAETYWQHPAASQQLSEVLLGGRVQVIQIIRTF